MIMTITMMLTIMIVVIMMTIINNIREFKDVVFEDVVFDNNRISLILYLDFT